MRVSGTVMSISKPPAALCTSKAGSPGRTVWPARSGGRRRGRHRARRAGIGQPLLRLRDGGPRTATRLARCRAGARRIHRGLRDHVVARRASIAGRSPAPPRPARLGLDQGRARLFLQRDLDAVASRMASTSPASNASPIDRDVGDPGHRPRRTAAPARRAARVPSDTGDGPVLQHGLGPCDEARRGRRMSRPRFGAGRG